MDVKKVVHIPQLEHSADQHARPTLYAAAHAPPHVPSARTAPHSAPSSDW
jgi:hypothetical protein